MATWIQKSDQHYDPRNPMNKVLRIVSYASTDVAIKSYIDLYQKRDGSFLLTFYFPSLELRAQCQQLSQLQQGDHWLALASTVGQTEVQQFLDLIDQAYHLQAVKQAIIVILRT